MEQVKAGTTKPFLISQPVPEKNESPVCMIVGKTFQQEVIYIDKDVPVEFKADCCGHCKDLTPS